MRNKKLLTLLLLLLSPIMGFAEDGAATIDKADTAWMLIATALVMLMTPAGLTLFYGGLTQRKSVLNTIGMSYTAFCTATLVWMVIGYSIAFGGADNPYFGGFEFFMLNNIAVDSVSGTIPTMLFVMFQGTFAAIAVALVSGSIIERVKFSTWMLFSVLWVILVYAPIAHWVWSDSGFLLTHGDLDFAGGTVIHINAGVSGLVLCFMLGNRLHHSKSVSQPASIKLMVLGSALLWFGWFGFNGGSELAADFITANALMVTNIAACAGGLSWLLIEWFTTDNKKPTLLGSASGVVSGLVGITPAAGFVDVSGALIIGICSGAIGYFGVIKLKKILGYDDTLDVFGIHGLVGIFGALATGVFANPLINDAAGLLYGNPGQLLTQGYGVIITIIYSALVTPIVFKVVTLLTSGGRIDEILEKKGMDEGYHGEKSFDLAEK